jgi:hypothetical protein
MPSLEKSSSGLCVVRVNATRSSVHAGWPAGWSYAS